MYNIQSPSCCLVDVVGTATLFFDFLALLTNSRGAMPPRVAPAASRVVRKHNISALGILELVPTSDPTFTDVVVNRLSIANRSDSKNVIDIIKVLHILIVRCAELSTMPASKLGKYTVLYM